MRSERPTESNDVGVFAAMRMCMLVLNYHVEMELHVSSASDYWKTTIVITARSSSRIFLSDHKAAAVAERYRTPTNHRKSFRTSPEAQF